MTHGPVSQVLERELNIGGNSLFTNYNSCVYLAECSWEHNGRYVLGPGMACGCAVGCGGAEQGGCWAASTINAGGDSRPAFLRHESVPTTASLIRRAKRSTLSGLRPSPEVR
jgi:hypothetical protein